MKMIIKKLILIFILVEFILAGCSCNITDKSGTKSNPSPNPIVSASETTIGPTALLSPTPKSINKNKIVTTAENSSTDTVFSKRMALDTVFNYIFSEKDKAAMEYLKFSDSPTFYGYEYKFKEGGTIMRIEFSRMLKNKQYYEFWLCEQIYYDEVFDHAVTSNFYAVGVEKNDVIQSRDYPDDCGVWTNNPLYPDGAH
ncbi:MAG: hypothetical protein GX270_11915 [Clostridiaceae bacterium]|nr:hypothetical protein [Clostridiaceae bacterium]